MLPSVRAGVLGLSDEPCGRFRWVPFEPTEGECHVPRTRHDCRAILDKMLPGQVVRPPRCPAWCSRARGWNRTAPRPVPYAWALAGRSLRDQIFFFLLRTALKDRPKGPPTANHQLPSTANRHQPPATNRRQPPAATNRQLPTTANRHQPPITNHQPPPTTTNRHQPPVANCQPPTATNRQPPTANRHQPWLSTWSARGLFWENWFRNTFFFPVKDRPGHWGSTTRHPTAPHLSKKRGWIVLLYPSYQNCSPGSMGPLWSPILEPSVQERASADRREVRASRTTRRSQRP